MCCSGIIHNSSDEIALVQYRERRKFKAQTTAASTRMGEVSILEKIPRWYKDTGVES
jgi:hypothetical protein